MTVVFVMAQQAAFAHDEAAECTTEVSGQCCDAAAAMCSAQAASTAAISTTAVTTAPVAAATAGAVPVNLDLASAARNVSAAQFLPTGAVPIQVGEQARTVSPADLLTPAELVAVMQVASTGAQSIVLDGMGTAVGGTFSLSSQLSQAISSLSVPAGVTAVHDVGAASALNLAGNFTNSGNFYALSSNPAVTTASISAANIFNQQGGLLTTILPAGGLPGFTSAVANLNLSLTAIDSVINYGTISSAGNLAISAGGAITNAGVMSALQSVNLASAAGSIVNSGLIAAIAGNISVTSQLAQTLLINNVGGALKALNGAIDIRDALFTGLGNISVRGGDLVARELNLYSGSGAIEVNVDDLVGNLNASGYEARVYSSSDTLTLGRIDLSGDPTFYNIGDIQINGNVSVNEKLAILASQNITATANLTQIVARAANGQGFDIHLVAGANLSPACGDCASDPSVGPQATAPVSVSPLAPNGGNIDLSGASPTLQIFADSNSGNRDGGNVTLVAFANGATGGNIILPSGSEIKTAGSGSGNNGNITLIAGATGGTSVTAGKLTASGGTGTSAGTGVITIATAQPTTSNGLVLTFDTTGAITTGNTFAAGPTTENASVSLTNAVAASNQISVTAGSGISNTAGSGTVSGSNVTIRSTGGAITVNESITGTSVLDVRASGAITTTGAARLISDAGDLKLTSDTASVGVGTGAGERLAIDAGNLTATALAGSVFLDELDAVNLGTGPSGASAMTGTFDLVAGGAITSTADTGTVGGNTVALRSTGAGVTVNADITGASSVAIQADGGVTTSSSARIISSSGSITLQSDNGSIGSSTSSRARVNAANLIANASNGSVFLDELDAVNLGAGSSGASGTFDLVAGGAITNTATTGTVSAAITSLRSTGGAVTVSADVTGTTSLGVQAAGDITGAARLRSPAGTLTVTSDGGNLGTDVNARLLTEAASLVANAATSGKSVFISELDGVNLGSGSSSAGATFDLLAAGNITNSAVSGTVAAADVVVRTTSGTITANADITGTNTANLRATGNITTPAAGRIVSAAGLVTISSDSGSIGVGTAAGERVRITAGNLVANAAAAGQNVFLSELDDVNLGPSSSSAGATFDLLAGGAISNTATSGTVSAADVVLAASAGTITVNADVTGISSVRLDAAGDITTPATGRVISSNGLVTLVSDAGNIGSGPNLGERLLVTAANLVADASGSGRSVFIEELDGVNLGASPSAAGAVFDLLAPGDISTSGTVSAGNVFLRSTGGAITAGASISGNLEVRARASGDIRTTGSARLISSTGTVTLTSDLGNIGTGTTDRVKIDAGDLVANATTTGKSVFLDELNGVNLGSGSSSAAATFDLLAAAAITNTATTGTVSAQVVEVRSTGGAITLGADVTGTTSVTVRADDDITTTGAARVGSADGQVTLTSDTGSIGVGDGAGQRLLLTAKDVVANAPAPGKNVFLQELDDVNLGAASSGAGGNFDLVAAGNITNTAATGTVLAASLELRSTGGTITVNADLTGTTTLDLRSSGDITTVGGARLVSAGGTVILTSDGGSIGTGPNAGERVVVTAGNLVANAGTTGKNVFIEELDALTVGPGTSAAGATFDLLSGGAISIQGSLSAPDTRLRTTAGGISAAADVTGTNTLTVRAAGDITTTGGARLVSSAGSVSLTSDSGSIGSGPLAAQRVLTNAANLVASAITSGGSVFIAELDGVNLGAGASAAAANFDLLAGGAITNTTGTGSVSATDVSLRTTAGDIIVSADVSGTASANVRAAGGLTSVGAARIISSSGAVTLTADSGSIGTGGGTGQRLQTTAGSLVANATGSGGSVFIDELNDLVLGPGASAAAATFDLLTGGAISTTAGAGTVSAPVVVLRTTSGDITASADLTGTTSLTIRSAGSILTSGGARLVSAGGIVALTADSGSIGTGTAPGGRVLVTAGTLAANAATSGQSVFLSELNAVTLSSSTSSAGATFDLLAGGAITVGADVTGSTSVILRASGDITTTGTARVNSAAGTVSLTSDTGSIGSGSSSGARVRTTAGSLVANAAASGRSVFIEELDAVTIGTGPSAAGSQFDVVAGGAISVTGAVTSTDLVFATSTGSNGGITISANSSGTSSVTLAADGAGVVTVSGGSAVSSTGGAVSISASDLDISGSVASAPASTVTVKPNGSKSIGFAGSGATFNIDAGELGRITTGTLVVGDATLAGGVSLLGSYDVSGSGAGNFNLTFNNAGSFSANNNTLTLGDKNLTISAGSIALGPVMGGNVAVSLAATGSVSLDGSVALSGSSITVSAGGNITQSTGTLTATTITLSSTSGSIGQSVSPIAIDADNLTANAPSGSVFITDTDGVSVTDSSAGAEFSLSIASGTLTASSLSIGAGGTLSLTNDTGAVSLLSPVSISGGTVNLSAGTTLATLSIDVSNQSADGDGGTIVLRSGTFEPANLTVDGSLSANGSGLLGIGGAITAISLSEDLLAVNGSAADPNRISGSITANGVSGGRIELLVGGEFVGRIVIREGGLVQANGTSGSGGRILLSVNTDDQGLLPLIVINDGTVEATNTANDSGRIGIHSDVEDLIVGGTGTFLGGEFVSLGNLDTETLDLGPGFADSISIDSRLTIENAVRLNPRPGSTPLEEGEIATIVALASTPSGVNDLVDEQIAGRIPTDLTPANAPQFTETGLLNSQTNQQLRNELIEGGIIQGTTLDALDPSHMTTHALRLTQMPNSNYFKLEKGNVLFSPDTDIIVGTQEGDVHVPAGSSVFIIETGHDVAIYDLHDPRSGSVKIVTGKRMIKMQPGRQVVLTRQMAADFDTVNPGARIASRRPKGAEVGDGIKAFASDFSIPSAVTVVEPLRKMLRSDRPQDRKLVNQMLTNAVILSEMTAAAGPFRANR